MSWDLIQIRIKSFAWEMGTSAALAFVAWLSSPEAAQIINDNFGDTVLAGVVLFAVTGLAKHIRNWILTKNQFNQIGGGQADEKVPLI